jgi:two-component sensor histidine kinase
MLAGFWRTAMLAGAVTVPGLITLAGILGWTVLLLRRDDRTRRRLRAALHDNQLLFREIHHRVKNNLQQVAALVRLQPVPADLKSEMNRRIAAMVAVHEHMYRSDQYARIEAADYLPQLVRGVAGSFAAEVDVDCEIADIEIDREHALPLSLIVNEVVGNAIKHAFTGRQQGHIAVRLERDGAEARLTVRDNGSGFDVDQDNNGMGSKLIRALAQQMNGTATLSSDSGTVFTLVFPVA